MTDQEKAQKVANMLLPDVVATNVLLPYIELSGEIVSRRRYPFRETITVPTKYEHIQCLIAVELWNKRGAEGQTTHNENGINRTWEGLVSHKLLSLIVPKIGSVTENEDS